MNRTKERKTNACSKGIFIELIATFVLVTVILMVALDTKGKTGLAPLLIGFTLAVAILAMLVETSLFVVFSISFVFRFLVEPIRVVH